LKRGMGLDSGPLGEASKTSGTLGAWPLGTERGRLGLEGRPLGAQIVKNEELRI
jgi:hypothetical protein